MVKLELPLMTWLKIGGVLGVILAFFAFGGLQYHRGNAAVQKEWDNEKALAKVAAANLQKDSENVTTQVEIRYVDRIKTVVEKGDVIVREVPVFVPANSCELSGGFRLLHDAAATNTIPETTRIPYAPTVPAQTVARTVAENYRTCHEVRVNLEALQEWVVEQRKVYLEACRLPGARCSEGS